MKHLEEEVPFLNTHKIAIRASNRKLESPQGKPVILWRRNLRATERSNLQGGEHVASRG